MTDSQAPQPAQGCQHRRYSLDTQEQVGHCLDCGAEGRMVFVVPAPEGRTACEYCDGTGDVHSLDGEWRGECNMCPAAALHAFKNFHRLLCERFGYGHDEKDWRRDQLSLIEFIAAKIPAPEGGELPPLPPVTWPRNVGVPSWTAEEVQAYARAAVRAAQRQAERDNAAFERGYQHGRQQERQILAAQPAPDLCPASGLWCAGACTKPAPAEDQPQHCQGANCRKGRGSSEHSAECIAEAAASQGWAESAPAEGDLDSIIYKCRTATAVEAREYLRTALAALASKVQPKGTALPAGWVLRDRSDLEPGWIDIEGPGHPRVNIGPNPTSAGPAALGALARALLATQAPAPAQSPMVLVPRKPTPKMIDAGRWSEPHEESSRYRDVSDEEVAMVWDDMLAAAPGVASPAVADRTPRVESEGYKQRLAQDRLDAARYRFIRDADRCDSFITHDELVSLSMDSLDRAIDTAMKQAAAQPLPPVQGSGA